MFTNAVGVTLRVATLNAAIWTDGHCYSVQVIIYIKKFYISIL